MRKQSKIYVILDNIRSVHNVGSIFRTADGAGVAKIYLCGTTPAPLDRFGRKRADFHKVALGAEDAVPYEYFDQTERAVRELRKIGATIIAVEQNKGAIDYRSFFPKGDTAFIFGAEVDGVSAEILKLCDQIVEIPMRGKKESLNVSVTAGIILFNTI